MSTFHLEIVTPERKVVSRDVNMIVAKTTSGEIGVLAGHSPLVTTLDIGVLRLKEPSEEVQEEKTVELAIHGGFMDVTPDRVVVLAEAAEFPEEIDIDRALAAKERAEARMRELPPGFDEMRAELALRRALNRIHLAEHYRAVRS